MIKSKESNNLSIDIFKQAPVAIVIFRSEQYIIEFANDYYLQILGKTNVIIGKPLFESFPELKEQGLKEILEKIMSTGIPYTIDEHEFLVNRNNKAENLFFNCAYQPLREKDNSISGIIVILSEVTEQINARKLIEDSEKRYSNMFVNSSFAFAIIKDKNMVVTFANETIKEIWGKGDTIIGKELFEILPELVQQGFPEIINKVYRTGNPFYGYEMQVFVQRKQKLDECYFNFVYQAIRESDNRISGISIIAYEVTEQVLAKKIVVENAHKFKSMTDLMPVKVSYGDSDGNTNYFNQRWIDYTGLTLEELVLYGWDKIIHPDDAKISNMNWKAAINKGIDFEMEVRILDKNKHYNWHLNRVKPIRESNGEISHWIGINTEIHHQKIENEVLTESIKQSNQELIIANESLIQKNIELEISRKKLLSEYSRKLIEASLDPLVTINTDGKIMDMNKAMLEVVDKSREQLFNTNFCNYFTDSEKAKRVYQEVFDKGFVSNFPLVMKDGKLTDVLFNGSVYRDENNEVIGAVVVARDITDEKIAEKKLLQSLKEVTDYKLALDASTIVDITDKDGKILFVNQNYVTISKYSYEELIGGNHKIVNSSFHPEAFMSTLWNTISKGKVWQNEIKNKDKEGHYYWLNMTIVPFLDEQGIPYQYVAISIDITNQKELEKELTEAKIFAELATTIAEDAKVTAETATTKAEEAVKSKQQFLSNMSHEIRTPMNAIIGFTKVVLKTELTAKQKEYLMAIKMSGDALIVLINDILDLAKVDAGKMTFEKTPFKLKLSIKAMLHLFETKIHEKNLKLITHYDTTIPEVLMGDSVRLHQIILNLVSNAVKFTNQGEITVGVKKVSENDKEVAIQFAVTDTGIGIKDKKMEQIFENFQQATSGTSRIFGGTGLGLAIVKQLVQAQNGTINVKSEFGKGSTFSFNLNFIKTTADAVLEPEIVELNTDIKDTKILVVEDMELNQLLMKTILDDFGFECEIAGNGKIAVDKLQNKEGNKPFDIILMDLQMPEMNGFEATDYIRKTMKSNIPIIALTADVTTVDVAKCKAVGMNDYISKPVDERLLYSKLIGLMKKPVVIIEQKMVGNFHVENVKYVDMTYLLQLTKSNPVLMSELITSYLNQTPTLIKTLKQSFHEKDWKLLDATIHKMLPSFSIMGMSTDIIEMAKRIQEYANAIKLSNELGELVLELEKVCLQTCIELEIELTNLN